MKSGEGQMVWVVEPASQTELEFNCTLRSVALTGILLSPSDATRCRRTKAQAPVFCLLSFFAADGCEQLLSQCILFYIMKAPRILS